MTVSDASRLGLGFTFADLATREGLIRLDQQFLKTLGGQDAALQQRLLAARAAPHALSSRDESDLVVALGPHLDAFVATLFGIEAETGALMQETLALDPIHACKRLFVQRQAVKKYPDPSGFDGPALRATLEARIGAPLTERNFATHVTAWENDAEALDAALRYAAWATLTPAGQACHRGGTLFRIPHRVDPQHLVPVETIQRDGVTMLRLPEHDWRHREGFALTDHGMNTQQALDQVNYCIWCHTQGKDSCSSGL
ncbi:MAG: hypothetical protein JWQ55_1319, partial [Rhodopila sp.]|nr:hypothetical protein [Rhodopila sp.]